MTPKLEPLEKTLADLEDAERVRRAQQTVSARCFIGDKHWDRLNPKMKKWRGKFYEDRRKE